MVFVTGGTGFLGAYILKELIEKDYAVRAIRRNGKIPFFISEEILSRVEWVSGDVLDVIALNEAMEGAEAVIHSAAKVSFHRRDKSEMHKINIEGTANVVNAAIQNNVKRFIHVSSVASLGRKMNGDLVNEQRQWEDNKKTSNYAVSKYYAEMEVWRGMAEGLQTVIVNPSTIIGYGDWNTSSCAIFKSVYDEFPWYTLGVNGFVDVRDVAMAIVLLMESNISGERFVLNGDNWSFQQLFSAIADGFKKKHPSRLATPVMAAAAWRLEKLKSFFSGKLPLLTQESSRIALSTTLFDNTKVLAALRGFSFTPLDQTIQEACRNYLKRLQS